MAVHQLNLQTLKDQLDGGRLGAAWDAELKRIAQDCEDRPGDDKPRKVNLEVVMQPVKDEAGLCEEVWVKVHVTSSVPKRRSKPLRLGVRRGGMLVFNDMSEDNPNQRTIDEYLGDGK